MSEQFFKKSSESCDIIISVICIDRCEMKNVQLFVLFFVGDSRLLSLCVPVWNKFSLWRRTFHCTFDFQNFCTAKERSLRFVFRHKRADGHIAEGSRGSRPLPFFYTVQIVPSNSLTNLEETFWKVSKKKNPSKRSTNINLLKFFKAALTRVLINVE